MYFRSKLPGAAHQTGWEGVTVVVITRRQPSSSTDSPAYANYMVSRIRSLGPVI